MSRFVLSLCTVASQRPLSVPSVGGWPEVDAEHGCSRMTASTRASVDRQVNALGKS